MKKNIIFNNKEFLYNIYIIENKSIKEVASIIGVNDATLIKWLKKHDIKKTKELIAKCIERTNLERFGSANVFSSNEIKEKIKSKNIEKYGFEHSIQNKNIKDKAVKTNIERYGCQSPLQNKSIRDKIAKTMVDKYGAKTTLESQDLKNKIIEYSKQHGCEWPTQIDFVKEKIKDTSNKKYGGHHMKSKEFVHNLVEKRGGFILNDQSAYQYAKECKFPTSLLNNILKSNNAYSDNEVYDIINSWTNEENLTDIEIIANSIKNISRFNKKFLNYRPDFKINDFTYLNVDGLYWHSEFIKKDKMYHFNLRKDFELNGARIFQFRQDEIIDKLEIVKSIINNVIGLTSRKIFARKCNVTHLNQNEANIFLTANHLMGTISSRHVGLFYKNEIVSILSYKIKNNILKVDRFCSKINTIIPGAFSKLLSLVIKDNKINQIHYWSDLRYGTGNYLSKLGFRHCRDTLGWKWTDGRMKTFNRLYCRANMDCRGLSENEYAKEMKIARIYDAGQRLWIKEVI